MIELKNLSKTYNEGKTNSCDALKKINLVINDGESIAITGPSGAGKSTLLNILRAQMKATSGAVIFDGINIQDFNANDICDFKRDKISNIYQDYFLLEELSVFDNIELPLCFKKMAKKQRHDLCEEAIRKIDLVSYYDKKVNQLSGGEKQRVAIARAYVTGAKYILADEPTGALDSKNGDNIMKMLFDLNAEGKTLIYVTHDLDIASRANRLLKVVDGELVYDGTPKMDARTEMNANMNIVATSKTVTEQTK